jgi:hypothetical protein
MTALISRTRLAHRLGMDPRTLRKLLDSQHITPDFRMPGARGADLYRPDREQQLRPIVGKKDRAKHHR